MHLNEQPKQLFQVGYSSVIVSLVGLLWLCRESESVVGGREFKSMWVYLTNNSWFVDNNGYDADSCHRKSCNMTYWAIIMGGRSRAGTEGIFASHPQCSVQPTFSDSCWCSLNIFA